MRVDPAVKGLLSRRRASVAALLVPGVIALVLLGQALTPYLFSGTALRDGLTVQLRETGGLRASLGPIRFALLPRPRVIAEKVHVADASDALTLDADEMVGDVRLLPLLVGRVELDGVALRRPRLALDLTAAAQTIRQASSGGTRWAKRLGSLRIENGTLRIIRADAPPLLFAAIDTTIDWADRDASASAEGSLRWDDQALTFALWLGTPAALVRGGSSATSLHLHAADLDFAADGTLAPAADGAGEAFHGHLSATAASLAALAARAAPAVTLPAPFAEAFLEADARVAVDAHGQAKLDLQKLSFQADGNSWEGTLAFRGGSRPLVSATLATNRLMLQPFASRLPAPLDGGRQWSAAALPRTRIGDIDLDLRISASRLVAPPFEVDDAALAVISRERGVEITLIDGRLAAGILKARVSLGKAATGLSLHAVASIDGAEASTLTQQAVGRPLASGPLAAKLDVESAGDSVAALVAGLDGTAVARLGAGEVVEADGTRIATTAAAVSARLAGGVASIGAAQLAGPLLTLRGDGAVDLRHRTLRMRVVRSYPDQEAGPSAINISGPLDDPAIRAVETP